MAVESNLVMDEQLHQRISSMVEAMPAFPESVHQVMAMSSDITCSPKDLVQVIERDPVMTMKILKLVNSAFFALSRHVASVQHALVYLGMNTVKNLAVSIATVDTLPRQSIPELQMSAFLTYSLSTASVAQHLAREQLRVRDASDFFVGGLLHDFGKAVLVQFEPKTYSKVIQLAKAEHRRLSEVEMQELGLTSAEVGAMLAESWQLPAELVECIRGHEQCNASASDLTLAVSAASSVSRAMKMGDNGDPVIYNFSKSIKSRLGCELPEVVNSVDGLQEEVSKLLNMVRG